MGYYYKSNNIKFSSYACVKHMSKISDKIFDKISKNEIKLFNNCIKIITTNERHLTESTIDGFDTYFFGILIHRHLDRNAYDIYCSSKIYAYFVIKYLHKVCHDDYNKIYTTLYDKNEEIQKWILYMSPDEQIEFKTNFERNFRIEMINSLSEVIDSAYIKSANRQNDIYISVLMHEIVNTIIMAHAQEIFSEVSDEKLLKFMNQYEQNIKNPNKFETEFLTAFFDYITKKCTMKEDFENKVKKLAAKNGYNGKIEYEVSCDEHTFKFLDTIPSTGGFSTMAMKASLIKYDCHIENKILKIPTIEKRIKNKIKETITPENIKKKTIANIIQSEADKIKNILAYSNFSISDYPNLNLQYNVKYVPIIASLLKRFSIPFVGEMNLNLTHKDIKFYKDLECDITLQDDN